MAAYVANHRYSDRVDGERFDFVPGQVVDLSPAVAERINRNSPGAVSPFVAEPEPVEPASAPAASTPVVEESVPPDPGGEDLAGEDSEASESEPVVPRRGRPRKVR